jgi:hypothetical protein
MSKQPDDSKDGWLIVAPRRDENVITWILARSHMNGMTPEVRWSDQDHISIHRLAPAVHGGVRQ